MPAQGSDLLVIERSGTKYKTTAADVAALAAASTAPTIGQSIAIARGYISP